MVDKGPGAGWFTEGTKNSCALDPALGQGWDAQFSPTLAPRSLTVTRSVGGAGVPVG